MRWWRPLLWAGAVAACVVAVAGCGREYDLETVRARSDEMSERILEALYQTDACGAELDLTAIYREYADLADPDLARYVDRERRSESDPRARKQLDYLFFDLVGSDVYERVAAIDDSITNTEASGVIVALGDTIAYRDAGNLLYNETDSGRREELYLAIGAFEVEHTNSLRARAVERTREGLREYGFDDLDEFESQRRQLDHDRFEETVVHFLDETDVIYRTLTDDAAREIFGVDVADVPDYDRGRLFRGAEFDVHFPAEGMMPLLLSTWAEMGVDIEAIPAIHIDDEDRPEKEPRAAEYCVRPGEDVRVLIKPAGGVYDYETLFHEVGHALHDAFAAVSEYEFQRLGDYGVTETYAYIPEQLLSDEAFLEEKELITAPGTRRAFLRSQLLGELGSARYYAALFRYERVLHGGGLTGDELVEAYRAFMEEARLVPLEHPEFGYLSGNEDFYGVNYLEAWFLAAQVRAVLVDRFGGKWWSEPAAGAFLEELWAYGSELSSAEVARHLGYDGLDSSYFIEEIRTAFDRYAGGAGRASATGADRLTEPRYAVNR